MSRSVFLSPLALASAISLGALGATLSGAEAPEHRTMTPELEPLRGAFNADPESVRAVLLASPT